MVSAGEAKIVNENSLITIVKGCIAVVIIKKEELGLAHIWASGMKLEVTLRKVQSLLNEAGIILVTAIDKKERKKEIGLISIEDIEKYLRGNKVKRIIIDEIPQYILPQLGEIAVKVSPEGKVNLFYLDEGFELLGVKIYEIKKKTSSSVKESSIIEEWRKEAKKRIQEKEKERIRERERILEEVRKIVEEVFGIEIPENEESIFIYLREKFSPQEFAEKLKEVEKRVKEKLGKRLEEIFDSFMGVEPSGRDRETLEAIIEANANRYLGEKRDNFSPKKPSKEKVSSSISGRSRFPWIVEDAVKLYIQSLLSLREKRIPVDKEMEGFNFLINEYLGKILSFMPSIDNSSLSLEKINFEINTFNDYLEGLYESIGQKILKAIKEDKVIDRDLVEKMKEIEAITEFLIDYPFVLLYLKLEGRVETPHYFFQTIDERIFLTYYPSGNKPYIIAVDLEDPFFTPASIVREIARLIRTKEKPEEIKEIAQKLLRDDLDIKGGMAQPDIEEYTEKALSLVENKLKGYFILERTFNIFPQVKASSSVIKITDKPALEKEIENSQGKKKELLISILNMAEIAHHTMRESSPRESSIWKYTQGKCEMICKIMGKRLIEFKPTVIFGLSIGLVEEKERLLPIWEEKHHILLFILDNCCITVDFSVGQLFDYKNKEFLVLVVSRKEEALINALDECYKSEGIRWKVAKGLTEAIYEEALRDFLREKGSLYHKILRERESFWYPRVCYISAFALKEILKRQFPSLDIKVIRGLDLEEDYLHFLKVKIGDKQFFVEATLGAPRKIIIEDYNEGLGKYNLKEEEEIKEIGYDEFEKEVEGIIKDFFERLKTKELTTSSSVLSLKEYYNFLYELSNLKEAKLNAPTFLVSGERYMSVLNKIKDLGGVFVGVSVIPSLDTITSQNPKLAIIVDYDRKATEIYLPILGFLILTASEPEEFILKLTKSNKEFQKKVISEIIPKDLREIAFSFWQNFCQKDSELFIKYAKEKSFWLRNEKNFKRLKEIWEEGRVKAISGKWEGQSFKNLIKFLKENYYFVKVIYVSNILIYCISPFTNWLKNIHNLEIVKNIENLPKAKDALIISAENYYKGNVIQLWEISHIRYFRNFTFRLTIENSAYKWFFEFAQGSYEVGMDILEKVCRGGMIPDRKLSQIFVYDALVWIIRNRPDIEIYKRALKELIEKGKLDLIAHKIPSDIKKLLKSVSSPAVSAFTFASVVEIKKLDKEIPASISTNGGERDKKSSSAFSIKRILKLTFLFVLLETLPSEINNLILKIAMVVFSGVLIYYLWELKKFNFTNRDSTSSPLNKEDIFKLAKKINFLEIYGMFLEIIDTAPGSSVSSNSTNKDYGFYSSWIGHPFWMLENIWRKLLGTPLNHDYFKEIFLGTLLRNRKLVESFLGDINLKGKNSCNLPWNKILNTISFESDNSNTSGSPMEKSVYRSQKLYQCRQIITFDSVSKLTVPIRHGLSEENKKKSSSSISVATDIVEFLRHMKENYECITSLDIDPGLFRYKIQLSRQDLILIFKELLRNAVSKRDTCHIGISLSRTSCGGVSLVIKDDGEHINLERVRKAAIERGIFNNKIETADEKSIGDLLFMEGFSVREYFSDGRGLALVRNLVEKAGGRVSIENALPQGVKVIISFDFNINGSEVLRNRQGQLTTFTSRGPPASSSTEKKIVSAVAQDFIFIYDIISELGVSAFDLWKAVKKSEKLLLGSDVNYYLRLVEKEGKVVHYISPSILNEFVHYSAVAQNKRHLNIALNHIRAYRYNQSNTRVNLALNVIDSLDMPLDGVAFAVTGDAALDMSNDRSDLDVIILGKDKDYLKKIVSKTEINLFWAAEPLSMPFDVYTFSLEDIRSFNANNPQDLKHIKNILHNSRYIAGDGSLYKKAKDILSYSYAQMLGKYFKQALALREKAEEKALKEGVITDKNIFAIEGEPVEFSSSSIISYLEKEFGQGKGIEFAFYLEWIPYTFKELAEKSGYENTIIKQIARIAVVFDMFGFRLLRRNFLNELYSDGKMVDAGFDLGEPSFKPVSKYRQALSDFIGVQYLKELAEECYVLHLNKIRTEYPTQSSLKKAIDEFLKGNIKASSSIDAVKNKPVLVIVDMYNDSSYNSAIAAKGVLGLIDNKSNFSGIYHSVLFKAMSSFGLSWDSTIEHIERGASPKDFRLTVLASNIVVLAGGGINYCHFNAFKDILSQLNEKYDYFEIHIPADALYSALTNKITLNEKVFEKYIKHFKENVSSADVVINGIKTNNRDNPKGILYLWDSYKSMLGFLKQSSSSVAKKCAVTSFKHKAEQSVCPLIERFKDALDYLSSMLTRTTAIEGLKVFILEKLSSRTKEAGKCFYLPVLMLFNGLGLAGKTTALKKIVGMLVEYGYDVLSLEFDHYILEKSERILYYGRIPKNRFAKEQLEILLNAKILRSDLSDPNYAFWLTPQLDAGRLKQAGIKPEETDAILKLRRQSEWEKGKTTEVVIEKFNFNDFRRDARIIRQGRVVTRRRFNSATRGILKAALNKNKDMVIYCGKQTEDGFKGNVEVVLKERGKNRPPLMQYRLVNENETKIIKESNLRKQQHLQEKVAILLQNKLSWTL